LLFINIIPDFAASDCYTLGKDGNNKDVVICGYPDNWDSTAGTCSSLTNTTVNNVVATAAKKNLFEDSSKVVCAKCPDSGDTQGASKYYDIQAGENTVSEWSELYTITDCQKNKLEDETGTFELTDGGACFYSGE